jgi:catechol 2,3-dioxygenase-like lactoylglutathione lyase family enzyme
LDPEAQMNKPEVTVLKAHVAIEVRDLARSVDFYRRLWGVEPAKRRARYAKFDIAHPPLNLTLNEKESRCGALSHLGIQVASSDDVRAILQQWAERGLEPRDEMKTECCYALQDKSWVRDPDGNEWEVFVVLEDNLPEMSQLNRDCCEPACCTPAGR